MSHISEQKLKISYRNLIVNSLISSAVTIVAIIIVSAVLTIINGLFIGISLKQIFSNLISESLILIQSNNLLYIIYALLVVLLFIFIFKRINKKNPITIQPYWDLKDSNIAFDYCLAKAFPGQRGLCIYNGKEAVYRLGLIFSNNVSNLFWWRRGSYDSPIKHFEKLSSTKILFDITEYEIDFISVYKSRYKGRSFIYVETKADKPTGLYQIDIENQINRFGYASEEYAIYKSKFITREEYDDGAIKGKQGKIIDTDNKAQLRVRYLTKYNYIIIPQRSVYLSRNFLHTSQEYFDKLLKKEITFDKFIKYMETFTGADLRVPLD